MFRIKIPRDHLVLTWWHDLKQMKWNKYNLILVQKKNSVSEAEIEGGTDFYKGL